MRAYSAGGVSANASPMHGDEISLSFTKNSKKNKNKKVKKKAKSHVRCKSLKLKDVKEKVHMFQRQNNSPQG